MAITLPKISPPSSASSVTTAIKALVVGPLAALLGFQPRPSLPPEPPTVTILCYHKFDDPQKTPFIVPLANFREQMRYLSVQHIPVIPLSLLIAHIRAGTPIPDQSVVITIDDGYKSARTKAWPVLKKYGFPFTLFIYPQFLGKPAALSWNDVEEMSKAGVDIESHSLTHPLLTHPQIPMTRAQYIAWVDHELVEPKRELEAHLGKRVIALAYPFGGYDATIVERTQKAGYLGALTCDDGNVDQRTEPLHLNRRLVYRRVKPREFSQYFPDRTLQMAALSPRDGDYLLKMPQEIRGRIANITQVAPNSTLIMVDKLGRRWMPLRVNPQTGEFRVPLPSPLKTGYYFISLLAEDRAQPKLRREASWLFIISRNASK